MRQMTFFFFSLYIRQKDKGKPGDFPSFFPPRPYGYSSLSPHYVDKSGTFIEKANNVDLKTIFLLANNTKSNYTPRKTFNDCYCRKQALEYKQYVLKGDGRT